MVGKRSELKRARRVRGLSQADLAKRLRVTKGAVSLWESGERTPSDTLIPALAFVLGLAPERLLQLVGKD